MSVVQLRPVERVLTKKQLAAELGRSERWVELRMREGLPSLPPTRRYGMRRFVFSEVEAWLADGERVRPRAAARDRVGELERRVVGLGELVERLEARIERMERE